MSQPARVHSIFMLKRLRASLATFAKIASVSLEEAATEIQRTLQWLREDRYQHWKEQVRACNDEYVRAKLTLKRKEILDRALSGSRGSCVDERKALKLAERRLQEAEHKLRRVISWSQQIEKELSDYRGAVQGLGHAIDVEIPNARARLDSMVGSLEAYIALAPPEMPRAEEEKAAVGVAPPMGAPPMTDRPSLFLSDVQERAKTLRDATPSQQIRRQTPLGADMPDWVANLTFSETLRTAIVDSPCEKSHARPDDKIVLAQSAGEPDMAYLERTEGADGDSGWYIGVGEDTESSGYVATRIANLCQARPALTDILSLPEGSLVLLDIRDGSEMVLDPDNTVLWRSPQRNDEAPEQ